MISLEELVILGLAVCRITSLVVREDGPFHAFMRLRYYAGIRYDERSQPYATNEVSRALSCFWCTSVWFALVFAVLYYLWPTLVVGLGLPFALSMVAILVDEHVGQQPEHSGGYDGKGIDADTSEP